MTEESTKIEMIEQDDEVEVINERQNLLSQSKKVVKSKSAKVSCCKAIVITVAVIIFIAILIQIWADYGSYLETHSLPPGIHSMSSHCMEPLDDTCMTKSYNAPTCVFKSENASEAVSMECTTSKPNHHMVQTNFDYLIHNMSWDTNLQISFRQKPSRCVHLTIWSI